MSKLIDIDERRLRVLLDLKVSQREIARRFGVKVGTIKAHMRRLGLLIDSQSKP